MTTLTDIKEILAAWAGITIERFQGELDAKVYGLRTSKRDVQRSLLGHSYRFGSRRSRTNTLRKAWEKSVQTGGSGIDRVQIAFELYGRFVDMGVGKGVDHVLSKYARVARNGEAIIRRPKRWYAKRKGYETHRLRELLVEYNINIPLDLIENDLSLDLSLTL